MIEVFYNKKRKGLVMILKEWLMIWLNQYAKHSIKLKTYIIYDNLIRLHINPVLGEYHLQNLKLDILQNFISEKLEKGNLITNGKLSSNTILMIVTILKQALKQAVHNEIISKEYASKMKLPQHQEKGIMIFNSEECHLLERYCLCAGKKNYIGIIICLYTGIRIGELLALKWEDIDFEKSILTINRTCFYANRRIVVDLPKTKSSLRKIPLSSNLIYWLKKIQNHSLSPYIISTNHQTMVNLRSYQRTYQLILERLNIKYKNFHCLRHTFATRALEEGMDVKALSEILGHKNAAITLNRYAHSLYEHKKMMMDKIGEKLMIFNEY